MVFENFDIENRSRLGTDTVQTQIRSNYSKIRLSLEVTLHYDGNYDFRNVENKLLKLF